MSDLRPKALAALRDGRVVIVRVRPGEDLRQPVEVLAVVESSRNERIRHVVDLRGGEWSCVCGSGACEQPCPHVAAVQLVTTHDSPAARAVAS